MQQIICYNLSLTSNVNILSEKLKIQTFYFFYAQRGLIYPFCVWKMYVQIYPFFEARKEYNYIFIEI